MDFFKDRRGWIVLGIALVLAFVVFKRKHASHPKNEIASTPKPSASSNKTQVLDNADPAPLSPKQAAEHRKKYNAMMATGLREILVVEEKRQVIEYQLKEELYNWRPDVRPNVLGKFEEQEGDYSGGEWSLPNPSGHTLLRANADLSPPLIARAIARRLKKLGLDADVQARMRTLRRLGDPYSDADIAGAPAAVEGKTEMDALIAYLQGLGIKNEPDAASVPASTGGAP